MEVKNCDAPSWSGATAETGGAQAGGAARLFHTTRFAWVPALCLAVAASAALAADRHVYLDTNGNGQLNDCPNPAHNLKGTSNTDDMQYCSGGSEDGRILGAIAGTTTSSACTSGGGTLSAVRNGVQADIDQDGVKEFVYGHPQACVWNMGKSESCEVHAGTYRRAGAMCDEDCGNQSPAGLEGTLGVCDKFDCFLASVVALGDGPNLDGSGYGTAQAPAWIRGANVKGSVDSWDPNGDKDPSDGVYPAILSGDANGNGAFDATACSGHACGGDAFYGAIIGCGGSVYGLHFCRVAPEAGTTYIKIDSDADGSFDRDVGRFAYNTKEVHHLRIKDLAFTRYNGGNGGIEGTRPKTGTIDLNGGDGSTDGLVVDHVYVHDNDFTYGLDDVSSDRVQNEGYTENHWAVFNDHNNAGCTTPSEIRNSFLVQNNARLLNFDCGGHIPCGCEIYFHDNRVLVDVDPSKVPTYLDPSGTQRTRSIVVGYYKNIDINPREHRIFNNEFIVKSMGTSRAYLLDLQAFGNAQGNNNGKLWIYGNLFRDDPSATLKIKRIWQGFCDGSETDTGGYEYYLFNNTFDMDTPMGRICEVSGDLVVERNNAFFRLTSLYMSEGTTARRSNNAASTSPSDRGAWFDPGSFSAGSPGVHGGLYNYRPRAGGPLDGTAHCDPDGDGTVGVDWDGDGVQDTRWRDLSGHQVDCSADGAVLAVGAVQRSPTAPVCGNDVKESGEQCDGSDLGGASCASLGYIAGTLVCSTSCTWDTSSCTPDTAPPSVNGLRRTDRH